jgi:prepilin peptidase CpaA
MNGIIDGITGTDFSLVHGVLVVILMISLITDLKWRKIFNWVLLPGVIFGLLYHGYTAGLAGLVSSGQGLLLGLALLVIPFMTGGIGAGDVKLLGTAGALLGAAFVWQAFLATALLGGLMALGYLVYYKAAGRIIKRLGTALYVGFLTNFKVNMLEKLEETTVDNTFPYGVAIVGGCLFSLLMR